MTEPGPCSSLIGGNPVAAPPACPHGDCDLNATCCTPKARGAAGLGAAATVGFSSVPSSGVPSTITVKLNSLGSSSLCSSTSGSVVVSSSLPQSPRIASATAAWTALAIVVLQPSKTRPLGAETGQLPVGGSQDCGMCRPACESSVSAKSSVSSTGSVPATCGCAGSEGTELPLSLGDNGTSHEPLNTCLDGMGSGAGKTGSSSSAPSDKRCRSK
mmetsp:Transcript_14849/g.28741  ORF Transcript_14849/g.28741 Transcript_14849/m.28741 type:complete len:215 (-) Transcript_14849:97-741(-)